MYYPYHIPLKQRKALSARLKFFEIAEEIMLDFTQAGRTAERLFYQIQQALFYKADLL